MSLSVTAKAFSNGVLDERKRIVEIIKNQKKVYESNLKGGDSDWLEGAKSSCDYLIQLIKESVEGGLNG